MPIAMLLRSVPLVAMAPVLLLIFGQGKLGIATIEGPSSCCSRCW